MSDLNRMLQEASMTFEGPVNNPLEGLLIGNGDMGAYVTVDQHEIKFSLCKNDIWDSRFANEFGDYALKHDDLIRYEEENGFRWPTPVENDSPKPTWDSNPDNIEVTYTVPSFQNWMTGPNPKPAGSFIVRHNGLSSVEIAGRLDIATGIFYVDYTFETGVLSVEAFIEPVKNALMVKVSKQGGVPKLELIVEKLPDSVDKTIPMAEVWETGEHLAYLTQKIPAGYGVEEFSWCLAANYPPITKNGYTRGSYRCYIKHKLDVLAYKTIRTFTFMDEEPLVLAVGVATSEDTDNIVAEAEKLACIGGTINYDEAKAEKVEEMTAFWEKSNVWLDDEDLAKTWYVGLYGFKNRISKNDLFTNFVGGMATDDYSAFHGSVIWNMNIQRFTSPVFVANHLEWVQSYSKFLKKNEDQFKFLAESLFGLEGIYIEFISLPTVPKENSYVNNKWGRSLATLGWCLQPLWFYYEYTKDKEWLRTEAYPMLRQAANFYAAYMDKYQKENGGDIYPSMQMIEGPGWMEDFKGNRNVIDDLVMFKQTFEWVIASAEALDVDEEDVAKWKEALASVPPIKYEWDGEQGSIAYGYSDELGYADMGIYYLGEHLQGKWPTEDDLTFPYETVSQWLTYPYEYITGDGETDLDKIAAYRINKMKDFSRHEVAVPNNHAGVPFCSLLRVGGANYYESAAKEIRRYIMHSGQFWECENTEHFNNTGTMGRMPEMLYFPIQCINDILLQTQGDFIRIFPALPKGKSANFTNLRARSGFFVSASTDGKTITAEIRSELGEMCTVKTFGRTVVAMPEGAVAAEKQISFPTVKDGVYKIVLEEC